MFAIEAVEKNKLQLLRTVPTSKMLQLILRIHVKALFDHFKQINQVKYVSQKNYIVPLEFTKETDGLFKHIGKRTRFTSRVILRASFLEHMQKIKMAGHAKCQLLFLQMIMLKVDYAYAL